MCIRDSALRFEPVAFEASHVLDYDIAPSLPVRGDGAKLGQALAVLLDNAVKYAAPGTPIRLTAVRQGSRAVVSVTDQGPDIPSDKLPCIFDRFYQIQNNNPTMATGSGVGLHLVRQLVILHHGSITVEGHPDGTSGSRFTVSIPKGTNHLRKEEIVVTEVKPKREVAHAPLPQIQEIKKDKPRVRHRVLIVEDDEEIRLYLKQELRQRFYVDESANGQEALDMICLLYTSPSPRD